jgi:predicted O-linked N-acetylglucosamine transferase (SPINDLY family)
VPKEFREALQEKPLTAALQARCQDGLALHRQGELAEAEHIYLEVLKHEPTHFLALHLLGLITAQRRQIELRRLKNALASCDKAIARKPGDADGHVNRAFVLERLERLEDALASYKKAIALKPEYEFLSGALVFAKMQICDFTNAEYEFAQLSERILRGEKASRPFPILAISGSSQVQKKAAEIWIRSRHPTSAALPAIPKRPVRQKIRIGYFSADYCDHAVMHLMAELFERHDRLKFELFAFSFGPESNDEIRRRAATSFDDFIDVRNISDEDVALLCRNLEIDIAVDLMGFTANGRPSIFAFRASPIQISYLGYCGTMGADYIDYIVADPIVIPEESKQYYCEKIVYLPNSYQVNSRRSIAKKTFTRAELGLPPMGFVFCCFNNNYKITTRVLDCWIRILKKVEGSVLWLFESNEKAASNLRQRALTGGVNPERLIFAKRLPLLSEHLARYRSADLFLDTLPYNAHATASDALWAGLPVLTCLGETFAGRVAASLLNAINLPELVKTTLEAYEAFAIELADHPDRLKEIKQKLDKNRLTTPLFDTELFTKHIERAYVAMCERYHAGLPPCDILVPNKENCPRLMPD